jgi:hypothetical protein
MFAGFRPNSLAGKYSFVVGLNFREGASPNLRGSVADWSIYCGVLNDAVLRGATLRWPPMQSHDEKT